MYKVKGKYFKKRVHTLHTRKGENRNRENSVDPIGGKDRKEGRKEEHRDRQPIK